MLNGGYQIIDFKGINFLDSTPVKIDGVYELLEGTTKPTIVSGMVVSGKEIRDCYVNFIPDGQYYLGVIHFMIESLSSQFAYIITIADNDNVMINYRSIG